MNNNDREMSQKEFEVVITAVPHSLLCLAQTIHPNDLNLHDAIPIEGTNIMNKKFTNGFIRTHLQTFCTPISKII